MENKFISFSNQEVKWIKEEAGKKELSFSAMLRRIIDERYEKREEKSDKKLENEPCHE